MSRFINDSGDDVRLEDLEPWTTFLETDDGKRLPIMSISYSRNSIRITWANANRA